MRKIWLLFAQASTIALGVLLAASVFAPQWFERRPAAPPTTATLTAAAPAPRPDAAAVTAPSYADAAQHALPAVVHIFTTKEVKLRRHPLANDPFFRHFFGDRNGTGTRRQSGLGSGVIVSPEGYVLTNNHVIEAADEIEVSLADGSKRSAKLVGADPDTDLAVLRIESAEKLPAITFAASDGVRVGDVVLAIGNPFGVGQTVTMGIVSALGRSHLGINTFENFIQTDAAINPGNSGGALVDARGDLIGINTAIYSQSGGSLGIGFAVPAANARGIMEQLIATGSVTRGWIGVEIQELTPELAESFNLNSTQGALIAGVMRGSPADKGGIKPGDVAVAVAGKPVADASAMLNLISALPPGAPATLKLRRSGSEIELAIQVAKRPLLRRDRNEED
ncbi:MAG: Do family serine endopeptidase [Rhodocyclaceae bacterium]|nr:Do family serine endopeptidase [Rhodocyclaceae bacterium]MBX3669307.1 Do family serine endopeptidase [Rhodocyclaceae bacterium]